MHLFCTLQAGNLQGRLPRPKSCDFLHFYTAPRQPSWLTWWWKPVLLQGGYISCQLPSVWVVGLNFFCCRLRRRILWPYVMPTQLNTINLRKARWFNNIFTKTKTSHRVQFAFHEVSSRVLSCKKGEMVKESRNRPGVAQRVPGGLGSQISKTFGTLRWWGR